MIDLDVYRRTGSMLLAGDDIYIAEGLPWIYPPFAALLLVPTALVPLGSAVAVWWLLSLLCLWWLTHRSFAALLEPLSPLGRLAGSLLIAAAALTLLDPIVRLFAFGQVGLVLGALVAPLGQRLVTH